MNTPAAKPEVKHIDAVKAIQYVSQLETEFSSRFGKSYDRTYTAQDKHIHLSANPGTIKKELEGNGFVWTGGVSETSVEYYYNSVLFCYLKEHKDGTTSVSFSPRGNY